MNDTNITDIPKIYSKIKSKSEAMGFNMPSDLYVGSLLKTLIASKPKSNLLELGTGTGLSLSWMIDGMDQNSKIISVDNDPKFTAIAQNYFGMDKRVQLICSDGSTWIRNYTGKQFDLVFADAWPGKYSDVDTLLNLINVGGMYIIDDMIPQSNWPDGHQHHVDELVAYLENREDYCLTKMNWSTGIIIATRKR